MSQTSPQAPGASAATLRLLYLLTFIFIGAQGNFFPLWLREAGWSATDLGWLDACRYATVIIMPLYWGRIIDRKGDAVGVLKWLVFACVIAFVPIVVSTDFWIVVGAMTLWATFRVGQIPALDALTLSRVKRMGGTYGRFRSWGSIGFIVGGLMLGWLVELQGSRVIPFTLMGMLLLALAIVIFVPKENMEPQQSQSAWRAIRTLLSRPTLRALYLSAFLSRLTQHGLYGFLPLHLKDLAIDDWALPLYWSVGVMSEVLLIRHTKTLFKGRSTPSILLFCFSVAVLQFTAMAIVENPWILLFVMLLHGVTFGLWYVASMEFLGAEVEESQRGTAQALFQIMAFGLGGTISSVAAGYLFEAGAGPLMFAVSALWSLLVVVITYLAFKAALKKIKE